MDIYAFLADHGIRYQRFDHEAVFTTEESAKLPPMPGADTKNLFLRDEKKKRFFLVSVPHEKAVDLKALRALLETSALSFASPEKLLELLGVTPGSATILGLVHDKERAVELVIDKSIWDADSIQCHPLVNTGTLVIPHAGMETFLKATGHEAKILDVPARSV